jgi:hypothetical protein
VQKDTTASCTSTYRHGIWIISRGLWHPIVHLVQNILSLLKCCQQKQGGGAIIYEIFLPCTSQPLTAHIPHAVSASSS